ncbi:MAG: hypothetical protein WCQ21_16345 [Verrucomicrobiota bacterium]|jgi:hypothetical protein
MPRQATAAQAAISYCAVMSRHQLDAIVALTTGPAHVTDWV